MKAFACDSEIFPLVDAEMQRDFLNKDFETKDKPYAIYCDNQDQSFGVSFANYEIMVEIGCAPAKFPMKISPVSAFCLAKVSKGPPNLFVPGTSGQPVLLMELLVPDTSGWRDPFKWFRPSFLKIIVYRGQSRSGVLLRSAITRWKFEENSPLN